MTLKIGIGGGGWFAECFIPLFQAHPGVDGVALAEVVPERRERVANEYGIKDTFEDLEQLCESDVDAIAIFTQRWMHGPQAAHALRAGKHVYSAVPMGITLQELATIVELAEERQLVYSMGETSYYYPAALYCRERYRRGDLGAFVYGEGEYLHDLSQGFYEVFQRNGDRWKSTASYPPMLYPSHSVSIVLSVIGEHMTDVACLGYEDRSDDGVFVAEVSDWSNTFSNESALFRASGGGIVRINEMRRVGIPRDFVRLGLFGTDAVFEEAARRAFFIERSGAIEEVTESLRCAPPSSPHRARARTRSPRTSGAARPRSTLSTACPPNSTGCRTATMARTSSSSTTSCALCATASRPRSARAWRRATVPRASSPTAPRRKAGLASPSPTSPPGRARGRA